MSLKNHICCQCGRNASAQWYYCCSFHCKTKGKDAVCQACVEILHPGDERTKLKI